MEVRFENRVLLVDDEPVVLNGLRRAVSSIGYEALGATSMEEARRLFSTWAEHPCALALVDHKLQDGFGIELLPELSALDPAPNVALISGFLDAELAEQAFRSGALPMAKPSDVETLHQLLDVLGRLRRPEGRRSKSSGTFRSVGMRPETDLQPIEFGPFVLRGHSLSTPTGSRKLRHAESKLLAHLARRCPAAVGMHELGTVVLGRHDGGVRRSIYNHVLTLRLQLGPYAALVATDHGYGYRLALDGA